LIRFKPYKHLLSIIWFFLAGKLEGKFLTDAHWMDAMECVSGKPWFPEILQTHESSVRPYGIADRPVAIVTVE
jgi:hypothetical protein